MKKNFKLMISLVVAIFTLSMFGNTAFADGGYDNIKDGEYQIKIKTLKENDDDESAAAQFINNTATLSIQDAGITLTFQVEKGDMQGMEYEIKSMSLNNKKPIAENEDDDAKYFTFEEDSLKSIYPAGMNYVVPSMDMDHDVDFRVQLEELDELPKKDSEEDPEGDENGVGAGEENGDNDNGTTDEEEEDEVVNPQTGDSSNILLYSLMMIGALVPLTIIAKNRLTNK